MLETYLYLSRASSILTAVTFPSSTFTSISAAVFFVVSKLMTKAESLRISGPAEDNLFSKSSSRLFKVILKSFCCFVSPALSVSRSGLSALTTSPSNCSSSLLTNSCIIYVFWHYIIYFCLKKYHFLTHLLLQWNLSKCTVLAFQVDNED